MSRILLLLLLWLALGIAKPTNNTGELDNGLHLNQAPILIDDDIHAFSNGTNLKLTTEKKLNEPKAEGLKSSASVNPRNKSRNCDGVCEILSMLTRIVGWSYCMVWSFGFYPQVYANCVDQSVVGLSFDYVLFNAFGYLLYVLFNTGVVFIPEIREHYSRVDPNRPLPVDCNDFMFGIHAFLIMVVMTIQCILYNKGNQTVSLRALIYVLNCTIGCICFLTLAVYKILPWLQVLYLISFLEMSIIIIQYTPQVIQNHQRRDTSGWSTMGATFILLGAALSLIHMSLISFTDGDNTIFTANPVKLALGIISITFSIIFIYQNLILREAKRCKIWKSVITIRNEMNPEVAQDKDKANQLSEIMIYKKDGAIFEIQRFIKFEDEPNSSTVNEDSEKDSASKEDRKVDGKKEEVRIQYVGNIMSTRRK